MTTCMECGKAIEGKGKTGDDLKRYLHSIKVNTETFGWKQLFNQLKKTKYICCEDCFELQRKEGHKRPKDAVEYGMGKRKDWHDK